MLQETETLSRVAVVTGAGRGIGRAIALRFAHDGMSVAVVDLDRQGAESVAEEIRAAGGRAAAVTADVADQESVTAAVEQVVAELGAPTVLVNNAGVLRDNLVHKMTLEDWETVMGVHLRGAFLFTQACQTHMVEARHGRIVNMSSGSALGNRGQSNYSSAKAGLQGLTKTLAIELGPFGITVNAIAPGFVQTEMTEVTARRMGFEFDAFIEEFAKQIPVRRVGQPEDIADLAAYLVSEGAGYVSGQVVYAAGGPMG